MHARKIGLALSAGAAVLWAVPAVGQEGPSLTIGGTTYTKWLWGTNRDGGALYNFTTVPGEGYGDNGQGTELELLIDAKLSRQVEVKARLHSRFNQNQWTNYGGFGGTYDPTQGPGQCIGGSCGEYDPRSNQYVKLRGAQVILTPGYTWIDSATIGSNDFGQFDPFVIGRIRYIDRDNAQGLLFQGSALGRKLTWDVTRISLPRLWAGYNYSTGSYVVQDAAYGVQVRYAPSPAFDAGGLFTYTNDVEIDARDPSWDNGRSLRPRFRNGVGGLKLAYHGPVDISAAGYYSDANTFSGLDVPATFGGINGYSPIPLGHHTDFSAKVDLVWRDPIPGLVINLQYFNIGAEYVAMMAARREVDVLLTEGHDAAWAFPGPTNAAYGVFQGNPTRIGYGGWSGQAQQLPTINIDNEFTDFDEPMAETVIGWHGVTLKPVLNLMPWQLSVEYSYIGYNTNWQAWGSPGKNFQNPVYPGTELDTGVGHNWRSAYAPFSDRITQIVALRAKTVIDVGRGIDANAGVKFISETDKRMNDARYLPYNPDGTPHYYCGPAGSNGTFGDPPLCDDPAAQYTTSSYYSNPGTPGQWKNFDSLADDDRKLTYWAFSLGAGYQLFDDLYASLTYIKYLADLEDGNTAFQAYNLHEMASGKHDKNQLILNMKYILAGVEFGFEGQYNFGTFKPDFGTGFTPVAADATTAANYHVPLGSLGFSNRYGGWNSMADRDFQNWRLKAFMKAAF